MRTPAASPPAPRLELGCPSREPTEQPGVRDELVAADQRRDRDPGGHRPDPVVEDPEEQPRGAPAGLAHVDVRIGQVAHDRVGVPQHALGQDAMEVERHDDRHVLADDRARRLEQPALGIELVRGHHRPVHAEEDAVDIGMAAHGVEEAVGQRPEPVRAQRPGRRVRPRAEAGHDPDPGGCLEHVQCARHLALATALRGQEGVAAADVEVVGFARDRVEGGDFLDAFADEDPPLADGHVAT